MSEKKIFSKTQSRPQHLLDFNGSIVPTAEGVNHHQIPSSFLTNQRANKFLSFSGQQALLPDRLPQDEKLLPKSPSSFYNTVG